jgi:DNA replication ATP-dependent helicase Dna2
MGREEKNILAIQKTLDVEEDIWSPALGLRGKIDASVHAIVQPAPIDPAFRKFVKLKGVIDESKTREGSAPFEIKTGRAAAAMEHRAQTMLYTLLLSERTATPVPSGLLYYTQTSEVIEVPAARNEVRGLVTTRNQLAGWTSMRGRKWDTERKGRAQMEALVDGDDLALEKASGEADLVDDGPFLPPPIDDERVCSRCYALDTCMLFRRVKLHTGRRQIYG